jgi:hypothetical protein
LRSSLLPSRALGSARFLLLGLTIGLTLASVRAAELPSASAPFTDCDARPVERQAGDWTLMATGDLVPTDSEAANANAFEPFLPLLRGAGLVLGNLEGAITTHPTPRKRYVPGRSYAFRFPPATARLLKDANFHVISLANNHAYDYGPVGYADTVRWLADAGIETTGQPGSVAQRRVGGARVAVIALAHYATFNNVLELEETARTVSRARENADLVVLFYQLGAEGEPAAVLPQGPETFLKEARGDARAFAQRMVQAGAGLLIGHGPHVLRAAECIGNVPVLHSIGNFVSAGGLSVQGPAGTTVLPEFLIDERGGVRGLRIHPVGLTETKFPRPDPAGRGVLLMNWLSRDAARRHAGLQPLLLPGYEDQSAAFEEWVRGTGLPAAAAAAVGSSAATEKSEGVKKRGRR